MCNCAKYIRGQEQCCCPKPQALRLEVGKTYLARNGQKYKIVTDEFISSSNFNPEANCIGIGVKTEGWQNYRPDGKVGNSESKFDLISEYKEPVYRWFPVYEKYQGPGTYTVEYAFLRFSKQQVLMECPEIVNGSKRIGIYKIDLNTGEVWKEG